MNENKDDDSKKTSTNNFLLITTSKEYCSDRLIDWFLCFNSEFTRCNTNSLNHKDINVVSGAIRDKIIIRKIASLPKANNSYSPVLRYAAKELKETWVEFINKYANKIVFGSQSTKEPFRIKTLEIAKTSGLLVPKHLITNSKKEILSFIGHTPDIITKPIAPPYYIKHENFNYVFKTSRVYLKDVLQLEDDFIPTFFQERIERDFEVRVFYYNECCWGLALIVNKKNLTTDDIWHIKKRREIPVLIPDAIAQGIVNFMKTMNYNTGSLDFLVVNKKWYFLELNPSGEYDFVSKRGNYYLNQEIVTRILHERKS